MTFEKILRISPTEIQNILERCKTTPQDATRHPEAPHDVVPHNVYKHIKIVYNRAIKSGDKDLILSALFHDLGKVETTKPSTKKENSWSSPGHELVSEHFVEKYKEWIEQMGANWKNVFIIVHEHMRIKYINEMRKRKREDFKKNSLFDKIVLFSELDNMQTITEEELNI